MAKANRNRVRTEAKTRTRGVTVKITAMLDRELWARVKAEAVRHGVSAREVLTLGVEQLLRQWEKEER